MKRGPEFYGRTAVYRLYDEAGDLLYIGIANAPEYRWKMHKLEKWWWHEVARKEVAAWYDTRAEARAVERRDSLAERPRYDRYLPQNRLPDEERQARGKACEGKALRAIMEDIRSGAFPEMTSLPPERDLANRYGLARITFHGALVQAEKMGLLTSKHPRWLVLDPSSEAAQMVRAHGVVYGLAYALYGLHTPFRKDDLIARIRMPKAAAAGELGELRKAGLAEAKYTDRTTVLWTLLPKQLPPPLPGWRSVEDVPLHDDLF